MGPSPPRADAVASFPAPPSAVPALTRAAATASSGVVHIVDMQAPSFLQPNGALMAQTLLAAVEALWPPAAAPATAAAPLPAVAGGPRGGRTLLVEDVGPILERCDSLADAQALISRLCKCGGGGGGSGPTASAATLLCRAEADWSLAATPSPCALSWLEWLAGQAQVMVRVAPLPSGHSKDVHGRLVVTARRDRRPSVGGGGAGALPAYMPATRSVLFRLNSEGRVRAIGDVQFGEGGGPVAGRGGRALAEEEEAAAAAVARGRGRVSEFCGLEGDEEEERGRQPLPDPDGLEGDYD